jgi:hypothetical protein
VLKGSNKKFLLDGEEAPPNLPLTEKNTSVDAKKLLNLSQTSSQPIKADFRPASQQSMVKSNSTSVLERPKTEDGKNTNIQGNIIHITVNNYITNSPPQNAPAIQDQPKEKKTLAMSASHKDFSSLLKTTKDDPPKPKKGTSPQSSFIVSDKPMK